MSCMQDPVQLQLLGQPWDLHPALLLEHNLHLDWVRAQILTDLLAGLQPFCER